MVHCPVGFDDIRLCKKDWCSRLTRASRSSEKARKLLKKNSGSAKASVSSNTPGCGARFMQEYNIAFSQRNSIALPGEEEIGEEQDQDDWLCQARTSALLSRSPRRWGNIHKEPAGQGSREYAGSDLHCGRMAGRHQEGRHVAICPGQTGQYCAVPRFVWSSQSRSPHW